MSNRAVRKLHGAKDDLSTLALNLELEDEAESTAVNGNRKKNKPAMNLFDLVTINQLKSPFNNVY